MKLYERAGSLALGSRLRALAQRLTDDAAKAYQLHGVDFDPRWFPVFYLLANARRDREAGPDVPREAGATDVAGVSTVTELAESIGMSHAAVSQIVKAMTIAGLVESTPNANDGRVRDLALSAKGVRVGHRVEELFADVGAAVDEMLAEMHDNLWRALAEAESAFDDRGLYQRIANKRRERLEPAIAVRDFDDSPSDAAAFERLNLEWIEHWFVVEDADRKTLSDPWRSVLDPGGAIFMATLHDDIVGTCALMPRSDGRLELAKMAVTERVRGLGIGERLGRAVIDRARELGAAELFLESNTVLEPAITLYRKLGFEEIAGEPTPYARSNIQMLLRL